MNPRTFAYYNFGMGIFMIFMALALFIFPPSVLVENEKLRYIIPPMLVAYGVFRMWRALKVLRTPEE